MSGKALVPLPGLNRLSASVRIWTGVPLVECGIGYSLSLNRLSASVRIWTALDAAIETVLDTGLNRLSASVRIWTTARRNWESLRALPKS